MCIRDRDRAEVPKRIVVAGGGISGCEAAVIAAMRGHSVTLVERGERLGGQWNAASVPCSKADFSSFVSWQKHMLKQLGVTVILGREADREFLLEAAPDLVLDLSLIHILDGGGKSGGQPLVGGLSGTGKWMRGAGRYLGTGK